MNRPTYEEVCAPKELTVNVQRAFEPKVVAQRLQEIGRNQLRSMTVRFVGSFVGIPDTRTTIAIISIN